MIVKTCSAWALSKCSTACLTYLEVGWSSRVMKLCRWRSRWNSGMFQLSGKCGCRVSLSISFYAGGCRPRPWSMKDILNVLKDDMFTTIRQKDGSFDWAPPLPEGRRRRPPQHWGRCCSYRACARLIMAECAPGDVCERPQEFLCWSESFCHAKASTRRFIHKLYRCVFWDQNEIGSILIYWILRLFVNEQ